MDQAEEKQQQYQAEIDSLEEQMASCLADQNTLNNNNQTISRLQRSIDKIQQDLLAMSENDGDMGQVNSDLTELDTELHELTDTKFLLNERASYNRVASELLRDTGIKTKIIRQYVPVINDPTNQYLQILDFFVHFELDDGLLVRPSDHDTATRFRMIRSLKVRNNASTCPYYLLGVRSPR